MSDDYDIDPEFLYPSDADVLDISEGDDGKVHVRFVVPSPDTGDALELDAVVESVEESDTELPLDDELYD